MASIYRNLQVTIVAANVAQNITDSNGDGIYSTDFVIQCPSSNASSVFIGDKDSQLTEILPGSSVSFGDIAKASGKEHNMHSKEFYLNTDNVSNVVIVGYMEIL